MSRDTWAMASQQIKGLKDGDPVLINGDKAHALGTLRYGLLRAEKYYAKLDSNGKPVDAYLEGGEKKPGCDEEFVEAALLVYDGDTVVPAKCTFSRAKVGGIASAVKELKSFYADPAAWAAQSKDHEAAVAFNNDPTYAIVTNVRIVSRLSGKGNTYQQAKSESFPTTSKEWVALGEFFKNDPEAGSKVAAVFSSLNFRMNGIKALAAK